MQYLIGALSTAAFFVCLSVSYMLGRRSSKPVSSSHKETREEDRQKAEKLQKGFMELMSYDVSKALEGKKVT